MTDLVALTHAVGHLSRLGTSATQPVPQVVQQAAKKASSGGGSIVTPIAELLAWVLAGVYSVVPNYGVAIIGLSIIWMVLIAPLTLKSTRSMLAMQKLQPELKKLQAKHKDDRQAFAQAQMDLFREHNVSPFGSCLPMLLPLPVFFALFRVIDGLSTTYKYAGHPYSTPKFLNEGTKMYKAIVASNGKLEAFGMNLAQSPLAHHNGFLAAAPYWIAILLMAGTSYMQSAMMMSRNRATAQANPQMRMMKYMAPIFAFICIRFPVGVIVYYATSNICRILQQDAMYRFDPRVKSLVAAEVEEVEELTLDIDERERNRPGYTPPRGAKPAPNDKKSPAKGGGQPSKPPAPGGRSRFRDLLAAAAEQAETKQRPKNDGGPGAGGSAGAGGGRDTGAGGNGGSKTNGGGRSATNGGSGGGANDKSRGSNGRAGGAPNGSSGDRPAGGDRNGSGGGGANRRPQGARNNRRRRGR